MVIWAISRLCSFIRLRSLKSRINTFNISCISRVNSTSLRMILEMAPRESLPMTTNPRSPTVREPDSILRPDRKEECWRTITLDRVNQMWVYKRSKRMTGSITLSTSESCMTPFYPRSKLRSLLVCSPATNLRTALWGELMRKWRLTGYPSISGMRTWIMSLVG